MDYVIHVVIANPLMTCGKLNAAGSADRQNHTFASPSVPDMWSGAH
jgi:hypothetical protein